MDGVTDSTVPPARLVGAADGDLTPAVAHRCAQCGARCEPGISWCPQCYTALPAPNAVTGAVAGTGTSTAGSSSDVSSTPPTSPTPPTARRTPTPQTARPGDPSDADDVDRVADELLARLAGEVGERGPSSGGRLGSFVDRLGPTGTKAVLMVAGSLTVTTVAFALLYVLGAVVG